MKIWTMKRIGYAIIWNMIMLASVLFLPLGLSAEAKNNAVWLIATFSWYLNGWMVGRRAGMKIGARASAQGISAVIAGKSEKEIDAAIAAETGDE